MSQHKMEPGLTAGAVSRAGGTTAKWFFLVCLWLAAMVAPSLQQIDTPGSQGASPLHSPEGATGGPSPTNIHILTSLTAEELAAMTPEERLHVHKLMQQQQQQQLLMTQRLQQQIEQQRPQPAVGPALGAPPRQPPAPPLVVSSANVAGSGIPHLQGISAAKAPMPPVHLPAPPGPVLPPKAPMPPLHLPAPPGPVPAPKVPLAPLPFQPPPGAAAPLHPPTIVGGGGLKGSSMAGGSPTNAHSVPPQFLAAIARGSGPRPPGPPPPHPHPHPHHHHKPPPVPGSSPLSPEVLAQLMAHTGRQGPGGPPSPGLGIPGQSLLEAMGGSGGGAGGANAVFRTCPRFSEGAVCSGRYHRCTQDRQCAKGAKCCPDPCGMICQTAVPADGAILPGSLLVASCINSHCGSRGFFGSAPKTGNDCDAIKACRAGWNCCFNGCRNICRRDNGGKGSSGNIFSTSVGKMDKRMMLMLLATGGS